MERECISAVAWAQQGACAFVLCHCVCSVCVRVCVREREPTCTHVCVCSGMYISACVLRPASMRGWLSFPLHTWRFFPFYYSKCSLKAGYNIALPQTQITSQHFFQRKTLQNNPQMVSLPLFFFFLCLALSLCLSLHLSVCLYLCFGIPIYSLKCFHTFTAYKMSLCYIK